MEEWRSKPKVNTYLLFFFIIIIIFIIYFFQTRGVKLQMPYKMHTLWNSCIAGNKEPSANPTATLTVGLPFIGARKIPYLNINRAHPPSRGVLWQHIYILFRRGKKSIFLGINCQNNWFHIHKFKAMLLRPEKMKKKNRYIWIYFLTHKRTLRISVSPVSSNSQVPLGKTAIGKLLWGLGVGSYEMQSSFQGKLLGAGRAHPPLAMSNTLFLNTSVWDLWSGFNSRTGYSAPVTLKGLYSKTAAKTDNKIT